MAVGWGRSTWGSGEWGTGSGSATDVLLTGIPATMSLGLLDEAWSSSLELTGFDVTTALGDLGVGTTVFMTGVSTQASLASVLVWGLVPINPPAGSWVPTPAGPGGGWAPVSGGSGGWTPVVT